MFFLKTLIADITVMCILVTTAFIYLAVINPEQLNRIVCQIQTSSDFEYAVCRMHQKI